MLRSGRVNAGRSCASRAAIASTCACADPCLLAARSRRGTGTDPTHGAARCGRARGTPVAAAAPQELLSGHHSGWNPDAALVRNGSGYDVCSGCYIPEGRDPELHPYPTPRSPPVVSGSSNAARATGFPASHEPCRGLRCGTSQVQRFRCSPRPVRGARWTLLTWWTRTRGLAGSWERPR